METTIQERKFKPIFNLIDTDNDGAVSVNDLLRCAERARQKLGWTKEDPRFVTLVQHVRTAWKQVLQIQDLDHNGTISYKEYIGLIARAALEYAVNNNAFPPWAVEISNSLQRVFDVNGDGTYTAKEYAIYLHAIGSDADAKTAFAKFDLNKNGKLTYNEAVVLGKQLATSADPAAPANYVLTGKF